MFIFHDCIWLKINYKSTIWFLETWVHHGLTYHDFFIFCSFIYFWPTHSAAQDFLWVLCSSITLGYIEETINHAGDSIHVGHLKGKSSNCYNLLSGSVFNFFWITYSCVCVYMSSFSNLEYKITYYSKTGNCFILNEWSGSQL